MGIRPLYHLATALLIAFFLSLQVGSAWHEIHEDDHHGQDCFVCHIVSDEAEFLAIRETIVQLKPKFVIADSEIVGTLVQNNIIGNMHSRAPPLRGPPVSRTQT